MVRSLFIPCFECLSSEFFEHFMEDLLVGWKRQDNISFYKWNNNCTVRWPAETNIWILVIGYLLIMNM